MSLEFLIILFFVTAFLYSMVGFGGGSTYLALLVLFAIPYEMIPNTALICNIIVVSGGCYFFIKERHFSFRIMLPFLLTSIPFAFLGGRVPVSKTIFKTLSAACKSCIRLSMF